MSNPDLHAPYVGKGGPNPQVTEALLEMRRTLSAAVATAVGSHATCALLVFRDCNNFGDAAIWLGALELLWELEIEVRYSQPIYRMRPSVLRRAVDGPVLINGGGSFGDIYLKTQHFMLEIIRTFRDRRVVLLPQTVFFRSPARLEETKRVLGEHPDITLFCRDHESYETAKSFDCTVVLVPDMALALRRQVSVPAPTQRALWLLRRDREAWTQEGVRIGSASDTVDWEDILETDSRIRHDIRVEELLYRVMRRVVAIGGHAHAGPLLPISSARRLTEARVGAANRLLSKGACIVTDRLHAHLLSVMLGRFSVVMDNNFGKVRAFYETWTQRLPTTAWADSDCDVEAALDRMVPQ